MHSLYTQKKQYLNQHVFTLTLHVHVKRVADDNDPSH